MQHPYIQYLVSLGYQVITLDFETYYADDYSLSNKDMTTEAYVRDPRFQMILVSIKFGDGKSMWILEDRFRHWCTEVDWSKVIIIHHHAHFDSFIKWHHFHVRPAFILDTLSMARVVNGPKAPADLYSLCIKHGIGYKMDFVTKAKNKRLEQFETSELWGYGEYACNDADRTYDLANIFVPHLPTDELRLIDITVRMFSEPILVGDTAMLAAGVAGERERKNALLVRVGAQQCVKCLGAGCKKCGNLGMDKSMFSSKDKFANILRMFEVEPPMKRSPSALKKDANTDELTYAFAKTDPGMQELLEHDMEEIRFLAETRIAVTSTIISSRAQRFHDCSVRGSMPVYLKYGAAHTWRWGGGDKMNWQNMSSFNKLRPELAVLKNSICAPEGYVIARADASQIEARVIAYLAGQDDLVLLFAEGRDVYSEFAGGTIYMRVVDRKNNPADFIPGQLGKVCILGLGFGMGWVKFSLELLKGMLGAPPIQFTEADMRMLGIDESRFLNNPNKVNAVAAMISRLPMNERLIHCIVGDEIVHRYRGRNKAITNFWDACNSALSAMCNNEPYVWGRGILRTEGESIILPNGMKMTYRDIKRDSEGQVTYWNGRERTRTHGPMVAENVTQAIARIVPANAMLALHDMGIKVATMSHDEDVIVPQVEVADMALQYLMEQMVIVPTWAPGLPLAVEGSLGVTYGDAKYACVEDLITGAAKRSLQMSSTAG